MADSAPMTQYGPAKGKKSAAVKRPRAPRSVAGGKPNTPLVTVTRKR